MFSPHPLGSLADVGELDMIEYNKYDSVQARLTLPASLVPPSGV